MESLTHLTSFFFFNKLLICLKQLYLRGWDIDSKTTLLSACSLSKWLHQLGLYQLRARSEELNLNLLRGWQGSYHLSHHYCLPGSALGGSWFQEPRHGPSHSEIDYSTARPNAYPGFSIPKSLKFLFHHWCGHSKNHRLALSSQKLCFAVQLEDPKGRGVNQEFEQFWDIFLGCPHGIPLGIWFSDDLQPQAATDCIYPDISAS